MAFELQDYIEEKIEKIYEHYEKEFIRAQMFQDFDTTTKISKKLQKAKEEKILCLQRYANRKQDPDLVNIIDGMTIFQLTLDFLG